MLSINPKEWKYLNEGGEMVVFAPCSSSVSIQSSSYSNCDFQRKVLKIIKHSFCSDCKSRRGSGSSLFRDCPCFKSKYEEIHSNKRWIFSTILPFLYEKTPEKFEYFYEYMEMSEENLSELFDSSFPLRRKNRIKNDSTFNFFPIVVIEDNLLLSKTFSSSLTIEIKVKCGLVSHSPFNSLPLKAVCPRYSLLQLHKKAQKSLKNIEQNWLKGEEKSEKSSLVEFNSSYNPSDLCCSPSVLSLLKNEPEIVLTEASKRILHALAVLYKNPQNNLKIFQGENLVYDYDMRVKDGQLDLSHLFSSVASAISGREVHGWTEDLVDCLNSDFVRLSPENEVVDSLSLEDFSLLSRLQQLQSLDLLDSLGLDFLLKDLKKRFQNEFFIDNSDDDKFLSGNDFFYEDLMKIIIDHEENIIANYSKEPGGIIEEEIERIVMREVEDQEIFSKEILNKNDNKTFDMKLLHFLTTNKLPVWTESLAQYLVLLKDVYFHKKSTNSLRQHKIKLLKDLPDFIIHLLRNFTKKIGDTDFNAKRLKEYLQTLVSLDYREKLLLVQFYMVSFVTRDSTLIVNFGHNFQSSEAMEPLKSLDELNYSINFIDIGIKSLKKLYKKHEKEKEIVEILTKFLE